MEFRKALRLFGPLGVGALVVALLWWSFVAQRYECEVCVEFHGRRNCASASASSESAAARAAQRTACGRLARGRFEIENCAAQPPLSRRCGPVKKQ